jgi:hypothetical protein
MAMPSPSRPAHRGHAGLMTRCAVAAKSFAVASPPQTASRAAAHRHQK